MNNIKIVLICPIPLEYKMACVCLELDEQEPVNGCRVARKRHGKTEVIAVQSGPGKARAAQATTSAIAFFNPDIVLDTGTCAGIQTNMSIGNIIIGKKCVEFDISGYGFPKKRLKEMEFVSCFHFLDADTREELLHMAFEHGTGGGLSVTIGYQASGEYVINSLAMREELFDLFHVSGSNWETAGVFISALRAGLPVTSIRVVSDLGNRDAIRDFRRNAKASAGVLYQYIKSLIEAEWFGEVVEKWEKLPRQILSKVPKTVLPAQ
ncbi:MAG: hypothetical protein EHM28_01210 [Spirochaetaceae bacterium]|nr:MAG: hypothetical protein EHM28_01210 [Spirochaetaceae bacterium]